MPKDHPRVEAYGTVDELCAFIGRAVAAVHGDPSREWLEQVQHDLFALGAHLATPTDRPGRPSPDLPPLPESRPREMEGWIDETEVRLEPLRAFILPGGSAGAAELHVCRTVCRRAERAVVALAGGESDRVDSSIGFAIRYLNRLSDLLFVLARAENVDTGIPDVEWRKEDRR